MPATKCKESLCLNGTKRKVGATSFISVDSLAIRHMEFLYITLMVKVLISPYQPYK
jgi:hypothetical protein